MQEKSTSELIGHIDHQRRLLVRLFFFDTGEDHLAQIDSACSLTMVSSEQFAQAAGLLDTGREEQAVVASGEICAFREYEAAIRWFGMRKVASVFVPISKPESARRRQPPRDGEPELLVGSELFGGTRLIIDYRTNRIRVRTRRL